MYGNKNIDIISIGVEICRRVSGKKKKRNRLIHLEVG